MASGNKKMVINTRERAVSTDLERLQDFAAYDAAQLAFLLSDLRQTRAPFNTPLGGGVLEFGSAIDVDAELSTTTTGVGTPLKGDVIDGLCVLPQAGTLNLFVQAGAVWLDDPDGLAGSSDPTTADPDDSRLKLVIDPGVQLAGALVMAGGGGGTRIDVIECQRTQSVLETDSRDVFDVSTGLFNPVTVTKVVAGRLVYRVRQGTPGAGFPANAQGWLPLCVASVPSSAASVDDMLFWDVRPLVKDRVNAPMDSQFAVAHFDQTQRLFGKDGATFTSTTKMYGYSTAQIGMYRAGGGMVAGANPYVDLEDNKNWANGYTPGASALWFLYAVFPGGLPRWVQYNVAPSTPRIPNGPCGVLVMSGTGPVNSDGNALFTSIACPAASGLLASGPAALLAAGTTDVSNEPRGFMTRAGLTRLFQTRTLTPTSSTSVADKYTLVANVDFPRNASGVLILFQGALTGGTPGGCGVDGTVYLSTTGLSGFFFAIPVQSQSIVIDPSGNGDLSLLVELPTVADGVLAGFLDDNLIAIVNWNQSTGTKAAPTAQIVGWRI